MDRIRGPRQSYEREQIFLGSRIPRFTEPSAPLEPEPNIFIPLQSKDQPELEFRRGHSRLYSFLFIPEPPAAMRPTMAPRETLFDARGLESRLYQIIVEVPPELAPFISLPLRGALQEDTAIRFEMSKLINGSAEASPISLLPFTGIPQLDDIRILGSRFIRGAEEVVPELPPSIFMPLRNIDQPELERRFEHSRLYSFLLVAEPAPFVPFPLRGMPQEGFPLIGVPYLIAGNAEASPISLLPFAGIPRFNEFLRELESRQIVGAGEVTPENPPLLLLPIRGVRQDEFLRLLESRLIFAEAFPDFEVFPIQGISQLEYIERLLESRRIEGFGEPAPEPIPFTLLPPRGIEREVFLRLLDSRLVAGSAEAVPAYRQLPYQGATVEEIIHLLQTRLIAGITEPTPPAVVGGVYIPTFMPRRR